MIIDFVIISRLGMADGGRETWLNNFLKEAIKQRVEHKFRFFTMNKKNNNVLSANWPNDIVEKSEEIRVNEGWLPMSLVFLCSFLAKKFARPKSADFVVAVGGLWEALAIALTYFRPFYKGKKVLWLRSVYTQEQGYRISKVTQSLVRNFEIFLIRNFMDVVIANGEDTAEFYRGYGVNCAVIPNAIDLCVWKDSMHNRSARLRIAFIGRLAEVKGIDAFLESVRCWKLRKDRDEIEFHVIGGGAQSDKLMDLSENALICYHGEKPNDELPRLLEAIDCCVALTYSSTSFGGGGVSNALLEQMAAGKIIIAWRNNIFSKILRDDCAYLVSQHSVAELVQAYESIVKDIDGAEKKALAAQEESLKYSMESHFKLFFQIIGSECRSVR